MISICLYIVLLCIIVIYFIFQWNRCSTHRLCQKDQFMNYSNAKYSETLSITDIINLKKGQNIMTNMLREFDRICRKHNILYWSIGGTLIGVLRHRGWIPWDGDVDVGMLSEDYIKLQEIIQSELSSDLWFQDETTDINYKYNIGKIRHLHSSYSDYDNDTYHNGLQIDIFIYDIIDDIIIPRTPDVTDIENCSIDIIFPLKEMIFEDINVYVPNKYEEYSIKSWGSYPPKLLPIDERNPHEGKINPHSISMNMKKIYPHLYL